MLPLARSLKRDQLAIIEKATCPPPAMHCLQDFPVEEGCPLGYALPAEVNREPPAA
jgi:hypothetical protein